MVKQLVRASDLSVRLPYSQFLSALKAVKLVNPFLPSRFGAEQRHADSCIWQERGLALQKELCKQRHLQPLPAPFQLPCTKLHKEWPRCGCETQRLLHSKAFFMAHLKVQAWWHSCSQAPLLWGTEHKHQAALAPRQAAPGRQRKVGSLCSVSSTIHWPLPCKVNAAPCWRKSTMDITQGAVGDWGSLRGERGGQEADLPVFPSI